jgi:hypothetical protein
MIKNLEDRKYPDKLEIDLTGPDGNAYALMGIATNLGKQLSKDHKAIIQEMMQGDYEELLGVMEKHFGDHIIMWR